MANPKKLAFGLFCLSVVLIQGCFAEDDEVVIPNEHSVPEKLEHGEKGSVQYKVNTIKLTGTQHHKSDEDIPQKPPWPPRPGRRNVIPLKAKKALPTIIRPDRSILHSLVNKVKRNHPQRILRPGREDVPNELPPPLLRPGREDVPGRPPLLIRPGREDVPQEDYPLLLRPGRAAPLARLRPGREDVPPNPILRPGRNDIPDQYLIRPGRDDVPDAQPPLLRPGRDDVPDAQPPLLRPGREDVPDAQPPLLRPGREDVPQNYNFRPGRNDIPDQFNSVRAGKRSTGYNMPWTYVGSSVHSNLQHNSHTFRQKALEEKTKRTAQDDQQEMSVPNSFLDEQQDLN